MPSAVDNSNCAATDAPQTVIHASQTLMHAAFPFHLACDTSLVVVDAGASLQKLRGDLLGQPLLDVFRLVTPSGCVDFCSLAECGEQLVVLEERDTGALLRGQVVEEHGLLLFLVTLQCHQVEQLEPLGIDVSDFAAHDATMENIFLRQSHTNQTTELLHMLKRLELSVAEARRHKQAEATLVHDLQAAGDMMLRFDDDGVIGELRIAKAEYLGSPGEELPGTRLEDTLPEVHDVMLELKGRIGIKTVAVEYSLHGSGRRFDFEARVTRSAEGNWLLLAHDVTERKELQRKLEHAALHDPLTGLPNRALFQHAVQEVRERCKFFALMFIDINDFKMVNDQLGHNVGDGLLGAIADRLLHNFRQDTDTPARVGGDEFAVLLPTVYCLDQATTIAERVAGELSRPVKIGAHVIEPSVSVGVALGTAENTVHEIVRDADFAMYRAKRSRDRSVVACDASLRNNMVEQGAIKRELGNAFTNAELVAHYQPIVCMETMRCVAMEALVRWQHPTRGLVAPSMFLPFLDEMGLNRQLCEEMLEKACHDIARINRSLPPDRKPLSIHVNVSSDHAQDPRLVDLVRASTETARIPASWLTLEVTESALVADFENAAEIFSAVQDLGAEVAIDDFGVGYSSLNYVQRFPFDHLKLDRSLVSDVCTSFEQVKICECVVELGHALNIQVTAEGIEEPEQLSTLQGLGCDLGQGYLFARPMPVEEVIQLLQTSRVEPSVDSLA